MVKTEFVLHYPDGVVSQKIRSDVQPDAFLLSCPQGTLYWVSLNISLNEVTETEAKVNVSQIEIGGQKCELIYIFPLWHLLQGLDYVNELMRALQLPELPRTCYWVKEINYIKSYRGLKWSGSTFCSFTEPQVKRAIALGCVLVNDKHILKIRQSEEDEDMNLKKTNDKMVQKANRAEC